jgi:hypothetical protein
MTRRPCGSVVVTLWPRQGALCVVSMHVSGSVSVRFSQQTRQWFHKVIEYMYKNDVR